jgi:hypothetical protein
MGVFSLILGRNLVADGFLFFSGFCKKGAQVKKEFSCMSGIVFLALSLGGCAPLLIGAAVGGVGCYAVSRDTVQGDTDKSFASIWQAAVTVSKIRGTIKQEDSERGYLFLQENGSKVWIRLIRLTRSSLRLRIQARKYHLPNLGLAEELYTKIMEEAR